MHGNDLYFIANKMKGVIFRRKIILLFFAGLLVLIPLTAFAKEE